MADAWSAVFILSPPPTTVEGFFALFQENPLLGILDLDLLLTLDYLVMIPFYLALYVVVRRVAPAWGLLALVVGLFSLVLFVVTREATFSMWLLSDQHAAATSGTDRAALLAAGTTLLTLYNDGTFATSYILGAISTLLFSAVMVRHQIFGRLPGLVGVITGLTMLVPANAGQLGLVIAMVSLLPHSGLAYPARPTPAQDCRGNTHQTSPRTRCDSRVARHDACRARVSSVSRTRWEPCPQKIRPPGRDVAAGLLMARP